jgi:L-seryl-tRNA(Ser) seleniumtransferase
MVGRADLIEAARANGAPNQRFARALKVGKEEIAGLVAAVRRYVELDHSALAEQWQEVCSDWATGLGELPGVRAEIDPVNEAGQPVPRVRVSVDVQTVGRTAAQIVEALRNGDPGVAVVVGRNDDFYLGPDMLEPAEAEVVLQRVAGELS